MKATALSASATGNSSARTPNRGSSSTWLKIERKATTNPSLHPEKVAELQAAYNAWATRVGVEAWPIEAAK